MNSSPASRTFDWSAIELPRTYVACQFQVPPPDWLSDWAACQFIRAASDRDEGLLAGLVEFGLHKIVYRDEQPLHIAADYGWSRGVEILLGHGSDSGVRSCDGDTPLHYAAAGGHVDVARLLLRRGASAAVRNCLGATALHCAAAAAESEETAIEMITMLVAAGADRDARTAAGATALDIAICRKCLFEEEALRRCGAICFFEIDGLTRQSNSS